MISRGTTTDPFSKFVKRFSGYGVVLTGYIALMLSFNFAMGSLTPLPIPKIDILMAGPSHMLYSLEVDSFDNAFTIARPAEPYPITYWKLKRTIPVARPDTLLITLDPSHLSAIAERVYTSGEHAESTFSRYYQVINTGALFREFEVDYLTLLKAYIRHMGLRPARDHHHYLTVEKRRVHTSDLSHITASIDRHYPEEIMDDPVSDSQLRYLDSILTLCQKYTVTPIVIGPPLYKEYRAGIPTPVQQAFERKVFELRQDDITVFDRTEAPYPADHFRDAHHLNVRGSAVFTREVKQFLYGSNRSLTAVAREADQN